MKVKDLKFADYNPRNISKEQLENLEKSLKEFGDLSGIVFNKETGNLIGGHQRIKNFNPEWDIEKNFINDEFGTVAEGYIITPKGRFKYREVQWDIIKEKAANVAANKHGGNWEFNKLKDILQELDDHNFDFDLTGFNSDEIENLLNDSLLDNIEDIKEDNFNSDPPKETITILGDLYELNEHRLLCGNSTNVTDIEKLMSNKKADMVLTDPPYGINYTGGKETMFNHGKQTNKKRKKLLNDENLNIYNDFFNVLNIFTNNIFYIFYGPGTEKDFFNSINQDMEIINCLIWNKPRGSGALGANYKPCYEAFIYGKFKNGKRNWSGRNNQWTVFDFSKDKCIDHPTQKPIKLICNLITNHNFKIICDPFLGSGTTLISCELLNKTCFGLELSPNYCDVIIKRWLTYMKKENKDFIIKRNGQVLEKKEIDKYFNN